MYLFVACQLQRNSRSLYHSDPVFCCQPASFQVFGLPEVFAIAECGAANLLPVIVVKNVSLLHIGGIALGDERLGCAALEISALGHFVNFYVLGWLVAQRETTMTFDCSKQVVCCHYDLLRCQLVIPLCDIDVTAHLAYRWLPVNLDHEQLAST
jgi:hypothetical protein